MDTQTFDVLFEKLNPQQKQAVETLDGQIMVVAGPGTGKTQIIGMRTANIILKAGVSPDNILITTFTDAGVIAIQERLLSIIGSDAYKVHVATIHSFAQDVLQSFPEKFSSHSLLTAIDEIESIEIINEIVVSMLKNAEIEYLTSYGETLFYVRSIMSAINSLKREGISPELLKQKNNEEIIRLEEKLEEKRNNKRIKKIEKYEDEFKKITGKQRELHEIYARYNDTLRKRGLYDFNDMIEFALEAFREDKELQQFYAESYQYIMLDEYQDTNTAQNEIISKILSVSDAPNIMVVGDDDQSIYRFQGANIENMLEFTTNYPHAQFIVLETNYRSQQGILDAAHTLIEHNSERLTRKIPSINKELRSAKDIVANAPSLFHAMTLLDEEQHVFKSINALIDDGVKGNEIAIIVRSNTEVERYSEILRTQGIEIYSKREGNIFDNPYVQQIIGFLEILHDPYQSDATLITFMRSSLCTVNTSDVLRLSRAVYNYNYAKRGVDALSFYAAISYPSVLSKDLTIDEQALEVFISLLTYLREYIADHGILRALPVIYDKLSLVDHLRQKGTQDDTQDIFTLYKKIESFGKYSRDLSLEHVLHKLSLYQKYGFQISRLRESGSSSGVQILTAHSSKGLEFDHVFIPGLYSGNWESKRIRSLIKLPSNIAGDGLQFAHEDMMSDAEFKKYKDDHQLQEDRRLFFVALTRAKLSLNLSFPQSRDEKATIISPFVSEIGALTETRSSTSARDMQEQIHEALQPSPVFSYGESELEMIDQIMQSYRLSASDLNTFLISPKDFLYRVIFRYPFEQTEQSIFGTMYHRTLELFYKKLLETGKPQDYSYLEFTFLKQLEREHLTNEESERLKKRGTESLKGYYEQYKGNFIAPLKTEYRFSRRSVFYDNVPLTGIIDKIELLGEEYSQNFSGGSLFSQAIKIIDYKTGSTKYLSEILGQDAAGNPYPGYEKGRYGRQMMFYKLLFECDHELSSQYSLGSLELDFCEGKNGKYKRFEVPVSTETYEAFKKLVKDSYEQMKSRDFWKEYLNA